MVSVRLNNTPKSLENRIVETKKQVIKIIKEKFLEKSIKNPNTISSLIKKFDKEIKSDCDMLIVPYFQILENINLCVEVEMSEDAVRVNETKKFGGTKFSDIINNGMDTVTPINRFAISEKKFLDTLLESIERNTKEISLNDDSFKIEFN